MGRVPFANTEFSRAASFVALFQKGLDECHYNHFIAILLGSMFSLLPTWFHLLSLNLFGPFVLLIPTTISVVTVAAPKRRLERKKGRWGTLSVSGRLEHTWCFRALRTRVTFVRSIANTKIQKEPHEAGSHDTEQPGWYQDRQDRKVLFHPLPKGESMAGKH